MQSARLCPDFPQLKQRLLLSGPLQLQNLWPGLQHLVQFVFGCRRAILHRNQPILMLFISSILFATSVDTLTVAFVPPLLDGRTEVISMSSVSAVPGREFIASLISSGVTVCSISYMWKIAVLLFIVVSSSLFAAMACFRMLAFSLPPRTRMATLLSASRIETTSTPHVFESTPDLTAFTTSAKLFPLLDTSTVVRLPQCSDSRLCRISTFDRGRQERCWRRLLQLLDLTRLVLRRRASYIQLSAESSNVC